MMLPKADARFGPCFLLAWLALTLSGSLPAPDADAAEPPRPLTVSVPPGQAAFQRVFNPFRADALWPTVAGVYEPLLIHNVNTSQYVPWLATEYHWLEGNERLRFRLREGVRWSDGRPFTSRDVVFTFDLLKRHPGLDNQELWTFLSEVVADGDLAVEFRFRRLFTPGLLPISHQAIVARHAWEGVADPATFANPEPVGTGPFTEVLRVDPQAYELGRNPRYWQAGKPAAHALRVPRLASNDAVIQALSSGEVDWATVFVPDIQKTYVAGDPRFRSYWYPNTGDPVFMLVNTTVRPLDDARVRKAISLAIDRERITREALSGYVRPADVTGLPESQARWKDAGVRREADWTRYDAALAERLLDEVGATRQQAGTRSLPGVGALRFTLLVVEGWTDWEIAARIIAANLAQVGIEVSVKGTGFRAWNDAQQLGRFTLAVGIVGSGPTPYQLYRALLSRELVHPVGERAPLNFHRFGSARADEILRLFERSSDPAELLRYSAELQRVAAAEAPSLPLFCMPSWGVFNTKLYTGFPSDENPYATPSPAGPRALPVLVEARPR